MENEEKNQTEQDEKGQSVWKELWDYASAIRFYGRNNYDW